MKRTPYFKQLFPGFGSTATLFTELDDMFSNANSLFESSSINDVKNTLTKPFIDYSIKSADDIDTLEIPVPGITQDQVSVTLAEGTLYIKITAESTWTKTSGWKFILPSEADPNKIKAAVANGLLTITIPKTAPEKQREVRIL
jgi:HSP20 family molecular chaperone IbpA